MTDDQNSAATAPDGWMQAVPFVLPLMAFLLMSAWSPTLAPNGAPAESAVSAGVSAVPSAAAMRYVWLTAAIVVVVGISLLVSLRRYVQAFPIAFDARAVWVGIAGAFLWIGLCQWGLESAIWERLTGNAEGLGGRSKFDPWAELPSKTWQISFLAARLALLVAVVPLAEEIFLRGFLMRFVHSGNWQNVRLDRLGWSALVAGTVYGMLSHPGEALAAAAWFSLISWLMLRTGRFWNCVLAHAVTNGLLAAYIIAFGQWQLW